MGLEREHCQGCGTQEGEFETQEVEGIPMVLCSDCRESLNREARGDEERRKGDRRQIADRRFMGSSRRRHERRK